MRHPTRGSVSATGRTTVRPDRRRSESGDTLVEVLLALIVLGMASVALIIAFGTSISASADHRQLSASGIALDSISQEVISDIQATPSLFLCPNVMSNYRSATFLSGSFFVPTGFTAGYAASNPVEYWDTAINSFVPPTNTVPPDECYAGEPQQITITVVDTTNHQSFTNSFVVDTPLDSVTTGSGTSGTYGTASKLVYTTQPVGGSTGQLLATQPVITVEDSSGNTVLDDLSPVLLSLTGPGNTAVTNGATLTGCAGTETEGVITFSGCSVSVAGTYEIAAMDGNFSGTTFYSNSFTVSAATDYLVFSTQPVAGASGTLMSTQPVVTAYTSSGPDVNWTGTVTLTSSGGSLTNCSSATAVSGVATFTSCEFAGAYYYNSISGVYLATPYTLTASASNSVPTSPVTSAAFGVTGPGPASQLVFSTQPTGSASATTSATDPTSFATQPVVTLEDSFGNIVNSSAAPVTLTISSGSLNGCSANPLAASGGSASFSGCGGSAYGNGLTLTASSTGLSSTTSASFNITNVAYKLVFTRQPVAGVSGAAFEKQPIITIEDQTGNTVTASTTPITLTASGGILQLCTNLTPYEGVVSVATCNFAGIVGTPYTLTATEAISPTALTATSGYFTPSAPGTPTQLIYVVPPVAGAAGSTFSTQPVIDVDDSGGNVTTSSATISLASSGGTLSSCSNLTAVQGVVEVSGCTFGGLDTTSYTLTASSAGLSSAASNITPSGPGPASSTVSTVVASPSIVVDNGAASATVTVTLEDAYTNVISGKSITLGQGSTSSVISPNPVVTGSNGVSTFNVTDTNREIVTYTAHDTTDSVVLAATAQVSFATQLTPPTAVTLSYGTTPGSLGVSFTAPTNAPAGQTYTALACLDAGMSTNCVGPAPITSGGQIAGLTAAQGSAGVSYYVTITATASTGYLVSTSAVTSPHAATSQVNAPTNLTVVPSTTTAGALTATFTASSGTAPSSYTAYACTSPGMTSGCITPEVITSGGQITGLTAGAGYYVAITANPPTGYVSASSAVVGPAVSTQTLNVATNVTLSYGTTPGSIGVSFTAPTNAPGGQTYTAVACTGTGMTGTCTSPAAITSVGQITGLTAVQGSVGTSYYVEITATASTGYLASTSTQAGPQAAMSQVNAPTNVTVTPSTTTAGAVIITFANSTGTTPTSYSAQICTGSGTGCGTGQTITSGAQIGSLAQGTSYYVTITANAPTGYLPASVNGGPGMATIGMTGPTSVALSYGTTSGSLTVTFTAPPTHASAQSYTAIACTGSGMTGTCTSPAAITTGGQITGLTATQGSAGINYYATVTATASTGYLASTSTVAAPQADTSQVYPPTGFSTASSTTTAGAITATFTASTGVAPASYTAIACTGSGMTGTCTSPAAITTGGQITGLTAGTNYYVTITAVPPSSAYVSATTAVSAATLATTQLGAPSITSLAAGTNTASGSLVVNFTGSSGAPGGQTYTAIACTGSGMTGTCTSPAAITTGGQITGLAAGTSYYVTVTATASTGYLVSTSAQAGSSVATEQLNAPAITALATSGSNALTVTFSAPSNAPVGQLYSARACTGTGMTGTCFIQSTITSGGQFTGLATSTAYFVTVMAVASTGYTSSTSAQFGSQTS